MLHRLNNAVFRLLPSLINSLNVIITRPRKRSHWLQMARELRFWGFPFNSASRHTFKARRSALCLTCPESLVRVLTVRWEAVCVFCKSGLGPHPHPRAAELPREDCTALPTVHSSSIFTYVRSCGLLTLTHISTESQAVTVLSPSLGDLSWPNHE